MELTVNASIHTHTSIGKMISAPTQNCQMEKAINCLIPNIIAQTQLNKMILYSGNLCHVQEMYDKMIEMTCSTFEYFRRIRRSAVCTVM